MTDAARRCFIPILGIGNFCARSIITFYRMLISPLLLALIGPACRFEPTCSAYAAEALGVHGPIRGLGLAMHRLIRCRPGGGFGFDPVPRIGVPSGDVTGKI